MIKNRTDFEIIRSSGKAIYVRGLRVFEHTDGTIHVATPKFHTLCPRCSAIENFFKTLLKEASS